MGGGSGRAWERARVLLPGAGNGWFLDVNDEFMSVFRLWVLAGITR